MLINKTFVSLEQLCIMNSTPNTSLQRSLVLDIDSRGIQFLAHGSATPLESGYIAIDQSIEDVRQALENAVYDNAFLLNDYATTAIALHSSHFALMPSDLVKSKLASKVLEASFSTVDGDLLTSDIPGTDAAIACDIRLGVLPFIRRTFAGATILPHLVPWCAYCVKAYAEDTACMHIHLDNSEAHIVVIENGKLQMANTFSYHAIEDVAYYAMNMWKACHLNSSRDKVMLTGDNELRTKLAEQLRQWIAFVMPQMTPLQALKMGPEAATLPFNLLTLALF